MPVYELCILIKVSGPTAPVFVPACKEGPTGSVAYKRRCVRSGQTRWPAVEPRKFALNSKTSLDSVPWVYSNAESEGSGPPWPDFEQEVSCQRGRTPNALALRRFSGPIHGNSGQLLFFDPVANWTYAYASDICSFENFLTSTARINGQRRPRAPP